nr:hypothetical protein [uncultured Campylobacter sp.]
MKNEATLKFKNFNACPRFFWVHLQFARAGAALCCARPAEAVCLKISSADAKPMSKNLKSRDLKSINFKNGNATSADFDADRDMRLSAYRDINFNAYRYINSSADRSMCHGINSNTDRAINFKISNANLKADLAHQKADFR